MHYENLLPALLGGVLIGGAALVLLWGNGRIAGVSGILRGLVLTRGGARLSHALFLVGLVLGAWAYESASGQVPQPRADFPPVLLILAGVLVGLGTGVARGCTSGHGVCGLGRLSLRSLVAVLVFLGVAIVTTFVVRHVLGVSG